MTATYSSIVLSTVQSKIRGLPSGGWPRFSSPTKTTIPPPAFSTSITNNCTKLSARSNRCTEHDRLAVPDSSTIFPSMGNSTSESDAEQVFDVFSRLAGVEALPHQLKRI